MPIEPSEKQKTVRIGRSRKGIPNKATVTVKDAFREAFELLGGAEGLARWAATVVTVKGHKHYPNMSSFYELATKLIPTESVQSGTVGHAHYAAIPVAVEMRDALPAPVVPASVDPANVTDAVEVIDFIG